MRSKLLEGGGVDVVNYGQDCNHVIVDKIVYVSIISIFRIRAFSIFDEIASRICAVLGFGSFICFFGGGSVMLS